MISSQKVNDLSLKTVITTGIGKPGSMFAEAALNSLQNAMIFTPFDPTLDQLVAMDLPFRQALVA